MRRPPDPGTDAGWRRSNLGHLLFAATGRCVAIERAHVVAAGFPAMSEAQLALFRHLSPEGSRLTALAAGIGSTKQSIIELVDRAERRDLVRRAPDPRDGRAKAVRFTPRGAAVRDALDLGTDAAERAFAAAVGTDDAVAITAALCHYAMTAPARAVTDLLADAGRRFVRDVLGAVHAHGYGEVTVALLALFRTLELEGSRPTALAAAARITKQSMQGLVERAERLGLVARARDPTDGRATLIRFSDAGLAMLDEMRRGVARAERDFARATDHACLRLAKARLAPFAAQQPPA